VAKSMTELEPLVLIQERTNVPKDTDNFIHNHPYDSIPFLSMAQEYRIDTFISKLENTFEKNESNIPTSAVMELYEYKVRYFNNSLQHLKVMFKFMCLILERISFSLMCLFKRWLQ
jgi:hypothetical protein